MIKEKHSFIIVESQENLRLDLWVKECFSELSRSFIQSLILEGRITVNDKKTVLIIACVLEIVFVFMEN